MAVTGLEKITGKILSEAQADAARTIAEAQEKCDAVRAEYAARADALTEQQREDARREGERITARAKSGVAMDKRNILLAARADMIDETYAAAYAELKSLPEEDYLSLLVRLLTDALVTCREERKQNLALYGDEEVTAEPEKYEVILNSRDRDAYGEKVLAGVRRAVVGKVETAVLDKLVLSADTARMDGGLILKYGDVETNCSLEVVFADVRERTEAEVSRMLFD